VVAVIRKHSISSCFQYLFNVFYISHMLMSMRINIQKQNRKKSQTNKVDQDIRKNLKVCFESEVWNHNQPK